VKFVLVGPLYTLKPDAIDPQILDAPVHLPGYETDMRTAIAAMDICVLPSYREGFPRTLVEAAAMGKPIVTTDTGGCRDAVNPGESGLLVPVADGAALAEAIGEFVKDADFRREAGEKGRKKALSEYNNYRLVGQMVEVYLDALEPMVEAIARRG